MKKFKDFLGTPMTWGAFFKMYAKSYGIATAIVLVFFGWTYRTSISGWVNEKVYRFRHRKDNYR